MTREKKIAKLLQKDYDTLSIAERLDIAYEKFYRNQKMIYEEFVMMLMTNDELCFYYNDNVYQIDHSLSSATYVCIIEYNGNQRLPQRNEKFSSIIDMLDRFRIDGKRIREIWDDISL